MQNNGIRPASFFQNGSVFKCRIDAYNRERLREIAETAKDGDEVILFARTQRSKEETLANRGTPIENQPTHNLSLVTAQEVKERKAAYLANKKRAETGI